MNSILAMISGLMAAASLTSCTLTAKGYPVAGPAAKKGEMLEAKFSWSGGGSGNVVVVRQDGEVCKGRYATVVGGVVSPLAAQYGAASSVSTGGGVYGLQTSRAMLAGDRGSVVDFEGYTSGAAPTHGFGMAKDNKGSVWKLIW